MKAQHSSKEVEYIKANLNVKGFDVELSIDDEYFKLVVDHNHPIISDSACSDLYDVELALCRFNDCLDEIDQPERWLGVVKAAIERGFSFRGCEMDNILVDAEKYIIDSYDVEDCKFEIVSDFWQNYGGEFSQSLYWCDEANNVCIDASGRIVANDAKDRTYYRVNDGHLALAERFENDQPDVYVYLDTVVTTAGEPVVLLA